MGTASIVTSTNSCSRWLSRFIINLQCENVAINQLSLTGRNVPCGVPRSQPFTFLEKKVKSISTTISLPSKQAQELLFSYWYKLLCTFEKKALGEHTINCQNFKWNTKFQKTRLSSCTIPFPIMYCAFTITSATTYHI